MSLCRKAPCSSHTAISIATVTTTANRYLLKISDSTIIAPSARPTAIATGRLRPRDWWTAERAPRRDCSSDLEQLFPLCLRISSTCATCSCVISSRWVSARLTSSRRHPHPS